MKTFLLMLLILFMHSVTYSLPAKRIHPNNNDRIDVDVWVDRGEASVYNSGDEVRVYFRSDDDCYLVLYNIDADGRVRILFPRFPDDGFINGRRTYRIPDYYAYEDLHVARNRGVEYIHAIATRDFNAFRSVSRRSGHWLRREYISGDPFLAMNQINEDLILPSCIDGSATTFYFVDGYVWYPRYMCADCHAHDVHRYDPYRHSCAKYSIITVHSYDYWWSVDYYPTRFRFSFGGPFWRWTHRRHNHQYHPHHTHLSVAFGFGNYFPSRYPEHRYTDRRRDDDRTRRFANYERDYRERPSRYDQRADGNGRYSRDVRNERTTRDRDLNQREIQRSEIERDRSSESDRMRDQSGSRQREQTLEQERRDTRTRSSGERGNQTLPNYVERQREPARSDASSGDVGVSRSDRRVSRPENTDAMPDRNRVERVQTHDQSGNRPTIERTQHRESANTARDAGRSERQTTTEPRTRSR